MNNSYLNFINDEKLDLFTQIAVEEVLKKLGVIKLKTLILNKLK